jgi:hypothetical protein
MPNGLPDLSRLFDNLRDYGNWNAMAVYGGYTLPAQGQVDYKMKSFTDEDAKSVLGR